MYCGKPCAGPAQTILEGEGQEGGASSATPIKKADLYALGLSGKPGSEHLRAQVLQALDLPSHLSAQRAD